MLLLASACLKIEYPTANMLQGNTPLVSSKIARW